MRRGGKMMDNIEKFELTASGRRYEILKILQVAGRTSVTELAKRFSVSEGTIRRDVEQLEEMGLVVNLWGKITTTIQLSSKGFWERIKHKRAEKITLAQYIIDAGIIQPGNILYLGGGTSTYYLSQRIFDGDIGELYVITNAINIAGEAIISRCREVNLVLTSGELDPSQNSLRGSLTTEWIKNYPIQQFNIAFFSDEGISTEGVWISDPEYMEIEKAVIEKTPEIIYITTGDKIRKKFGACLEWQKNKKYKIITSSKWLDKKALEDFKEERKRMEELKNIHFIDVSELKSS